MSHFDTENAYLRCDYKNAVNGYPASVFTQMIAEVPGAGVGSLVEAHCLEYFAIPIQPIKTLCFCVPQSMSFLVTARAKNY